MDQFGILNSFVRFGFVGGQISMIGFNTKTLKVHLTNCTIVTFLQNNTKQKQESRMKIPLKKKNKGFHFRRQNKARNRSPLGVHITLRTL